MDKKEKKGFIAQFINLANGRFKDCEVDILYDIVTNPNKYDGKAKTRHEVHDGWSHDGKYTRTSDTTYTVHMDDEGLRLTEDYSYHDDDGASGGQTLVYNTAREFLKKFEALFGKSF